MLCPFIIIIIIIQSMVGPSRWRSTVQVVIGAVVDQLERQKYCLPIAGLVRLVVQASFDIVFYPSSHLFYNWCLHFATNQIH